MTCNLKLNFWAQEEIQCRQSNKRFRCVPSHQEEGHRCRCLSKFPDKADKACIPLQVQGEHPVLRRRMRPRSRPQHCLHQNAGHSLSRLPAFSGLWRGTSRFRCSASFNALLYEQDGGAGVLEALSTLLGPIGFFMIILLCVGVCIVYHNAKWD